MRNKQLDLLEALMHQMGPVPDSGSHKAAVNVVEFLIVCPVRLDVVDLKAYIGRYPMNVGGISRKGRMEKGYS